MSYAHFSIRAPLIGTFDPFTYRHTEKRWWKT